MTQSLAKYLYDQEKKLQMAEDALKDRQIVIFKNLCFNSSALLLEIKKELKRLRLEAEQASHE